jgi:hypothetical protein
MEKRMSDKQYTIDDMIKTAADKDAVEFQNAFNDVLLQKIADKVEAQKQELAKNYFNQGEEQPVEDQDTTDGSEQQEEQPNEDTEATA